MPRRTPPRRRKHEITVRMTPEEWEAIGNAAHARGERISTYMVQLAMAVASDPKETRGAGEQLLVHKNEERGAYVTT